MITKLVSLLGVGSRILKWIVNCADAITKLSGAIVIVFGITLFFSEGLARKTKTQVSEWLGITGAMKYMIADELDINGNVIETKPWGLGSLYLLDDDQSKSRRWENLQRGDILQAKDSQHIRLLDGCQDEGVHDCAKSPRLFTLQLGQCVVVLGRLYNDVNPSRQWTRKPTLQEQSVRGDKPIVTAINPNGGWLKVATTQCEIFN